MKSDDLLDTTFSTDFVSDYQIMVLSSSGVFSHYRDIANREPGSEPPARSIATIYGQVKTRLRSQAIATTLRTLSCRAPCRFQKEDDLYSESGNEELLAADAQVR